MSTINPKQPDVVSREGYQSYQGGIVFNPRDPLVRLRLAASSSFFGEPMFYQGQRKEAPVPDVKPTPADEETLGIARRGFGAIDPEEWRRMSPAQVVEAAIDEALDHDIEATLELAAQLRRGDHIRITPQVILVRAAHHPKGRGNDTSYSLVRKYGPRIVKRLDEPAHGLAYNELRFDKRPIPNSLKRLYADIVGQASPYELAKYRLQGHMVNMYDVVNLVHTSSEHVDRLMKGKKATQGKLTQTGETWEAVISAEGPSKDSWQKSIKVMGHMALLRNIRNFIENDVPGSEYLPKLIATTAKGEQLPFRYYSAYKAVKDKADGYILDAIEDCLQVSLGILPPLRGKVISVCDNSGSAANAMTSSLGSMAIREIGNLTGVIVAMMAETGYAGVFANHFKDIVIRKRSSVFDQVRELDKLSKLVGAGTNIWPFWKEVIEQKRWFDHIFIFSDMQLGHFPDGELQTDGIPEEFLIAFPGYRYGKKRVRANVPAMVAEYRKRVNPKVLVYLVEIAGYQDTIIPEYYDRTFLLGGWSDGILKFAGAIQDMYSERQAA